MSKHNNEYAANSIQSAIDHLDYAIAYLGDTQVKTALLDVKTILQTHKDRIPYQVKQS